MGFSHSIEIECPDCAPTGKKRRKPQLVCTERNYSGCGIDIGNCPECGHGFEISYRVDKVERAEAWDCETRAKREAYEAEALAAAKEDRRQEFLKLKAEFEP